MMMMATDLIRHSVVGSRDGLEDVLHDEGEGREAADHEEVGDGALKDGVNPILNGVEKFYKFCYHSTERCGNSITMFYVFFLTFR